MGLRCTLRVADEVEAEEAEGEYSDEDDYEYRDLIQSSRAEFSVFLINDQPYHIYGGSKNVSYRSLNPKI